MSNFPKDLLIQYKLATNKLRKFQRVVFKYGDKKTNIVFFIHL